MSLMNNKSSKKAGGSSRREQENPQSPIDEEHKQRVIDTYFRLFRTFEGEVLGRALKIEENSNSLAKMYHEQKRFVSETFEKIISDFEKLKEGLEEHADREYQKYVEILSSLKKRISVCLDGVFQLKKDFKRKSQALSKTVPYQPFCHRVAQYSSLLMDLKEQFCEERASFLKLLNYPHDLSQEALKEKLSSHLERLLTSTLCSKGSQSTVFTASNDGHSVASGPSMDPAAPTVIDL